MSGLLTAKETTQLVRRITVWKRKHKKSWEQVVQAFSVSRSALCSLRKGRPCRVDTAHKISKVIAWRGFRKTTEWRSLWGTEELQKAASTGGVSSQPLLLHQALHAAATTLYLHASFKGFPVGIVFFEDPKALTISVVLRSVVVGAKFPLRNVSFYIKERQLRYNMKQFYPHESPRVVGEGYFSKEGLDFCVEFLTETPSGREQLASKKVKLKAFDAQRSHVKQRR